MRFLVALSLALISPLAAAADLELTVSAGKHDRSNVPVRVAVFVPKALAGAGDALLTTSDGQTLSGQLTSPELLRSSGKAPDGQSPRELSFVLPKLAAGKELKIDVTIVDVLKGKSPVFAWHDTKGKYADLRLGDRPVLRYMYEPVDESSKARREETYKVYHHVFDPTGKRLMTKGPGGLFPHHRGLFYAFNKISYGENQQADAWHCNRGESQSHEKFLASESGRVLGRHRVAIDWVGRDKKTFAKEEREMTAYNVARGVMIDFASRLKSTVGKLKLDGDPQHSGYQFRASQDVPDKTAKQTYYLRPDGKDKPGSFRNWPQNREHENLPWNAMSIVLDEKRYTVAYLDHPKNPKPARFSERDYGRFGCYFPYELDGDKTLDVTYRVWLQEGEMTVEQVAALSRDFAEPPTVLVEKVKRKP